MEIDKDINPKQSNRLTKKKVQIILICGNPRIIYQYLEAEANYCFRKEGRKFNFGREHSMQYTHDKLLNRRLETDKINECQPQ